eukprot:SAG31_NODE_4950_length_2840_cov_2.352061_3_plen_515_part_00
MPCGVRCRRSGALSAAAQLLFCALLVPALPVATAAGAWAPDCGAPLDGAASHGEENLSAAARAAQRIGGGTSVEEALVSVQLLPQTATRLQSLLAEHGLRTAQDLRLLGGGPEADALLRAMEDHLSIGDRAKLRLLVGDAEHVSKIIDAHSSLSTIAQWPKERGGFSSSRRMLQEGAQSEEDGVSVDTLAIVFSVLVGAAGYIVQAITATRAQRSAEEQAHEIQISETRRQREHEQMVEQIGRTKRAVDECCGPALDQIWALIATNGSYTAEAVSMMESTHAPIIDHVTKAMAHVFDVAKNGDITGRTSGTLLRLGTVPPSLVKTYDRFYQAYPTSAGCMIQSAAAVVMMQAPYCSLQPEPILGAIDADPTTKLAIQWRRCVRAALLPLMQSIADIIRTHGAIIDLPPKDWQMQKFPNDVAFMPVSVMLSVWEACVKGFEVLIEQWDDGDHAEHLPVGFPIVPLGGLNATLLWSQQRGREKQKELIGMTKSAEKDVSEVWASITDTIESNQRSD